MNAQVKSGLQVLGLGVLACGVIAYAVYQNSSHIFDKPIAVNKTNEIVKPGQPAVTITGATFQREFTSPNDTPVRFAVVDNEYSASSSSVVQLDPNKDNNSLLIISKKYPNLMGNVSINIHSCNDPKIKPVIGQRLGLADALQALGAKAKSAKDTQDWALTHKVTRNPGGFSSSYEEKVYVDSEILGNDHNDSSDHPTNLQGMFNQQIGGEVLKKPFGFPPEQMVVQTIWASCPKPGQQAVQGQIPSDATVLMVVMPKSLAM
jgi:hypothetical protein